MELEDLFTNVTSHAKSLKDVDEDDMLHLYGLYKVAKEGPCNISKPYFWDFTACAKWKSWKSVSDITKEDAMKQYISLVKELDPSWDETKNTVIGKNSNSTGGLGVSVSTMAQTPDEEIADKDKSIFDWCEKGDLLQIKKMIKSDKRLINVRDENKLSLLHWSVDRGFVDISSYLVDSKCDINCQDEDLQTPLHYAVTCEHLALIELLLNAGADISIKDNEGIIPMNNSNNPDIQKLFGNS